MNKFLIVTLISLLLFEDMAEASSASRRRRRRKERSCNEQVLNLPNPKIDCLEINRNHYINLLIKQQEADTCSRARNASSPEEISKIASEVKKEKTIIDQCFGQDLKSATEDEKQTILKGRELIQIEQDKEKNIFLMGAVVVFALFLLMMLF